MTRPAAQDLLPVADRVRWLQIFRVFMLAALPALAIATGAPAAAVHRISVISAVWLALALSSWVLTRVGRQTALTALTVTLLGDGLVLAAGWLELGDLHGPVGTLIMLHAIAVTLAASFRTGVKIALWHSILALLVLNAGAIGLLGDVRPYAIRDAIISFAGLWVAVLSTAALAAANERELRRRRLDEKALRELALRLGEETGPGAAALQLARFAIDEFGARRAAVVVATDGTTDDHLGEYGLAAVTDAEGRGELRHLSVAGQPPRLTPDEAVLLHRSDPATDGWLTEILPRGLNMVIVPFAVGDTAGALVFELPRRRSARVSRRVERRTVATARQAAAQSAAAISRAIAAARLADAAATDGLTGLANRGRFDARLQERLRSGEPFGLVLVDLDHFKAVNDHHGHQVGDAVLVGVAQALRRAVGSSGLVARYGGEELVAIVDGPAHEAAQTAELLRRAVAQAGTPVAVTASLGVAAYPVEARTGDALIALADQRLYVAKHRGRDQVVSAADDPLAGLTGPVGGPVHPVHP
ncbi:diguanylate cyclase [Actinoplanes sp. TFC3]|uniref:GGDEF domain-containing protein n=1 Tax=Actinoplanes sp. TFC3 TaxID=1710355 RepID=UPI000833684C|nr:GGDEF domain-containing protein [Actinoplanes sp. TFC3]